MQLKQPGQLPVNNDRDLLAAHTRLTDANILELGCGSAFVTRKIAEQHLSSKIIAAEVDSIQHEKNLLITDLPNVEFVLAGMQDIPLNDDSIDTVVMLKSLHHVPVELLEQGFSEVQRVLKPGGCLYISEPVFDGEFNEILRLFNNEESVRQKAFDALKQAVSEGLFELQQEIHFLSESRFKSFSDFENRIINATHSEFHLDDTTLGKVKTLFESHPDLNNGDKRFLNPMRVDILCKPQT